MLISHHIYSFRTKIWSFYSTKGHHDSEGLHETSSCFDTDGTFKYTSTF